jgi:hypothetical protein
MYGEPPFDAARRENEKACRGRRCGRLSEKNRTTATRRSAAVPTDFPWEEEWAA